jgi:hypothetical protein
MVAVSQDDLQKKRDKNERLREQIAAASAQASERVQEQSNTIEASQLDAETARLELQLAAAKEQAKVTVAREGAEGPLSAVQDQLEAAKAGVTPPGVAVDTNAGSDKSGNAEKDKE